MGGGDGGPSVFGLGRIWRATRYSLQGLAAAYRHEAAFRQEIALGAVLIPLALFLTIWSPLSWTQCALLVASVLLVLLIELVNSAVETVVDRISDDRHALSQRAKDTGSAAVFMALVICVVVWVAVLVDAFAP